MNRLRILMVAFVVAGLTLGAAAASVWSQTVTGSTGSITGRVTDDTGAVLPGVTVTATSPSMQGQQVAITNEEGNYRIPAVPPGEYRIVYELPGFATVIREGIRVGLGFTANIEIQLKVATLEETVTVSGESPVVDVASTQTATNFDADTLASLPGARDFWSILAQSPAVQMQRIDVGGSRAGTQTPYAVYDTKADQHRPMVEGMVMTEGTGGALFYYDFGSMDEVAIGTGTHGAEMGWPGVISQFVAKSGGNEFHGSFRADYQNKDIQAENIDEEQIARGVRGGGGLEPTDLNRAEKYNDLNADIGGYVAQDKLWFYGSARRQHVAVRLPNFPVLPHPTFLHNYSAKATYSLNQNNKFIGYTMGGRKNQPYRLDTHRIAATQAIHTSPDSTWNQKYWGFVHKGEWNSVLNDRMFFEVRGGKIGYDWPNFRYGEGLHYEDLGNNEVFGGNREWQQDRHRHQLLGSFSLFQDGWAGSHNFKFGGEAFREIRRDHRGLDSPFLVEDVMHILRNGAPIEVYLFESPSTNDSRLLTLGAYVSDTWRVNSHLTMNVGLRFDRYRGYIPEQVHNPGEFHDFSQGPITFSAIDDIFSWNLWAPRLGITYDLAGNGKTVLKANYAYYYWNPGADLANSANPNAGEWFQRRAWSDVNGDGRWNPGEEGRIIQQTGGTANIAIDPDIDDTKTTELAGWIERELIPNFGIRSGFVYRKIEDYFQQHNANRPFSAFDVPVSVADPGPDGVLDTGDDGPPIQAWNLDPAFLSLPTLNVTGNLPGEAEFYTWEISGTKRLSNSWSLLTGFSYQWARDHEDVYQGNRLRADNPGAPVNPNETINTVDGRYNFETWSFKTSGQWQAPYGLVVSPTLRHQSGQPFGRIVNVTLNYGSQRILAEPLDSQRQDNITVVDVRMEKQFVLGGARRIGGYIDVYNLFNANPAENINWVSGTTFLQPSNIVSPRIARFGIRFDF